MNLSIPKKLNLLLTLILGIFFLEDGIRLMEKAMLHLSLSGAENLSAKNDVPVYFYWFGMLMDILIGLGFIVSVSLNQIKKHWLVDKIFYLSTLVSFILILIAVHVHVIPALSAALLPMTFKSMSTVFLVLLMIVVNYYLYRDETKSH